MKILYIYRDYKGRRKKYGEMMTMCGHEVTYMEIREKKIPNQVKIKHIKKYNPDIVWVYTPYYISRNVIPKNTLEYIHSKKIPIVMYSTIDPETPWMDEMHVWREIDYLFIHYKPLCDYLRQKGLNAHYMPLGFYPDQYYKIKSEKIYDISFMGNSLSYLPLKKDKRSIYLQSLERYNIKVFGESFNGRLENIPIKRFRSTKEQRTTYAKSKINLDLPFVNYRHPFYDGQYHFKNRFFEIPATCNFMLALRTPEALEIFPEDTIGYYDDSIESLKGSVRRYLKDSKIRKKMSKKAYKIVHEKYTYLHMFKNMFKIIEE
jgi:spore maturation protein CgeB